ncbi:EpsG family protein [Phocaeicola plebeius]|uniref:EpsG family protein n=1 Tax=Phocaeicola plebeius TaxID=310297 RepID=UPI00307FB698
MENFFSIYSLIYIPIIFSCLIENIKQQKQIIIFWIIILTLFRGLRWECGTDWPWYEQSFNEIDITNFWCYVTTEDAGDTKVLEAGWGFLLMICHYLFGTYTAFLLITNAIRFFFIYKISLFFTQRPIICFVSIVVSENFFPVRQDLANVIFYYGLCWLIANKGKLYLIYNGIATLIHSSSIILVPLYWILKKIKFKFSVYIIILILSYLLANILVPTLIPILINLVSKFSAQLAFVLSSYFYAIEDSEELNLSSPILAFILNLSLFTLFYYNLIIKKGYAKLTNYIPNIKNKEIVLYTINAFILNIIINQIFLREIPALARLASYFSFSVSILFSMYFQSIKTAQIKAIAYFLFITYMLYRYYKHFGFYPELMFPYRSIFGTIT